MIVKRVKNRTKPSLKNVLFGPPFLTPTFSTWQRVCRLFTCMGSVQCNFKMNSKTLILLLSVYHLTLKEKKKDGKCSWSRKNVKLSNYSLCVYDNATRIDLLCAITDEILHCPLITRRLLGLNTDLIAFPVVKKMFEIMLQ